MTLIELVMGMAITSMVTVVLAGLAHAIRTTQHHVAGVEDSLARAEVTFDRLRYVVDRVGSYRSPGGGTRHGLAVVSHVWDAYALPDVLVAWTGGRDGDLSDDGVLDRLPRMNELVVFAPSPSDPSRLVEVVDPSDTSEIDFDADDFDTRIGGMLRSQTAEAVVICNGLRAAELPETSLSASSTLSNVWFHLVRTPADDAIAGVTPGSADWYAADWSRGVVSSRSGLRRTTLDVELQLDPHPDWEAGAAGRSPAVPFFGSASVQHVYEP